MYDVDAPSATLLKKEEVTSRAQTWEVCLEDTLDRPKDTPTVRQTRIRVLFGVRIPSMSTF